VLFPDTLSVKPLPGTLSQPFNYPRQSYITIAYIDEGWPKFEPQAEAASYKPGGSKVSATDLKFKLPNNFSNHAEHHEVTLPNFAGKPFVASAQVTVRYM
jgi:hypothetical protein